jgi:hypothetical protein
MASVFDATRPARFGARPAGQPLTPRSAVQQTNSISASQARAARRRAARRDEQAVAAWLRELAGRTR